jgi:cell division protein FtsB
MSAAMTKEAMLGLIAWLGGDRSHRRRRATWLRVEADLRAAIEDLFRERDELKAENKRLREALEPFVKETPHIYLDHYRDMLGSAVEKARAALAPQPDRES